MTQPHPDLAVFDQALTDYERTTMQDLDLPVEPDPEPDTAPRSPVGVTPNAAGVTFLRSTTTTRVDRERDNDVKVRVEHVARFAIEPGAVADMLAQYSRTRRFRPSFFRATWVDGQLESARLTGPLTLKAGGVSDKVTCDWEWRYRWERDDLPAPLPAALADYETAVAVFTGGPR